MLNITSKQHQAALTFLAIITYSQLQWSGLISSAIDMLRSADQNKSQDSGAANPTLAIQQELAKQAGTGYNSRDMMDYFEAVTQHFAHPNAAKDLGWSGASLVR
jgi:hypothetical protein